MTCPVQNLQSSDVIDVKNLEAQNVVQILINQKY